MAFADDLLKGQGIHPDSSGFYQNLKAYIEPRAAQLDAAGPGATRRYLIESLEKLVKQYGEERTRLIPDVLTKGRKMDDLLSATDRFARADAALKRLQAEEKNETQMAAVAAKKAKEGASREPIAMKPKAPRDEVLDLILNPRPSKARGIAALEPRTPGADVIPAPAELKLPNIPRCAALEREIATRFGPMFSDNNNVRGNNQIDARTFLQLAARLAQGGRKETLPEAKLSGAVVVELNQYARDIARKTPGIGGTVARRVERALTDMNQNAEKRYAKANEVKQPPKPLAAGPS